MLKLFEGCFRSHVSDMPKIINNSHEFDMMVFLVRSVLIIHMFVNSE
jgi:hypothetical protein